MIKISGIFKCKEVKQIKDSKVIKLVNSEKDKEGKWNNTYYDIWVNDKVSGMINPELKKKLTNTMLTIEGWLRVNLYGNYVNLTIYPTSIKEYMKQS